MFKNIIRLIAVVVFILSLILGNGTVINAQNYSTIQKMPSDNSSNNSVTNSNNGVTNRTIDSSRIRASQRKANNSPDEIKQVSFFSTFSGKPTNSTNEEEMPDFPKTPGVKYVKVVNERGETVYVPEEFLQDYQQQTVQKGNTQTVQKNTPVQNSTPVQNNTPVQNSTPVQNNTVVPDAVATRSINGAQLSRRNNTNYAPAQNTTLIPSTVVMEPTAQSAQKSKSIFSFVSPFTRKSTSDNTNQASTSAQTNKQSNIVTVTPAPSEPIYEEPKSESKSTLFSKPLFGSSKKNATKESEIVTTNPYDVPILEQPVPTQVNTQVVANSGSVVNNSTIQTNNSLQNVQNNTIENPFAQSQGSNSVYVQQPAVKDAQKPVLSGVDKTFKETYTAQKDTKGTPSEPEMDISAPEIPDMVLSEQSIPSKTALEPVPEMATETVQEVALPEELPLPDEPEPKPSLAELAPVPAQSVPVAPAIGTDSSQVPIEPKSTEVVQSTDVPNTKQTDNPTFPLEPVELDPVIPDQEAQIESSQQNDIPVVQLPEKSQSESKTNSIESSENPLQLDIQGPNEVEFGKNEKFTLVISNNSKFPMTNLTLRVHPQGFGEDKTATVKIVELAPSQPRRISMKLNARQKDKLSLMANIANESGIIAEKEISIAVKNEKVKITIVPPTHNPDLGDKALYTIRVANHSDELIKFNVAIFFSEGLEPDETQGIENKIQSGQVTSKAPVELKANESSDIFVKAVASVEGVHTTLVQLTDLQGNTYTARNNCTYGRRTFPVPLKTKSDEVKTLDSASSSSDEVLIQDDQAAPMPSDLGIDELPGVTMEDAVPEVPVPEVPVPEVPVPEVPVPETSVPEVPVQEASVPEVPVQEASVPEVPVSETSVPEVPVPEVPVSEVPVSEVPVPEVTPEQANSEQADVPDESVVPNAPLPDAPLPPEFSQEADESAPKPIETQSEQKNDNSLIMSDFMK